LGIDASNIRETSFKAQGGIAWFEQQDEATQKAMLGPGKFAAWIAGDFDLKRIVRHVHSDEWGDSIAERSLKELTKA
jgi:hypothetical protein